MRILVIGATGTIGEAVAEALAERHQVVRASRRKAEENVDLADASSVRSLFERVGRVDAVVSAAGQAAFTPLAEMKDEDFVFSLGHKLMGQVNVVRFGMASVADGGSITLTSGALAQRPEPGTAAISLVNSGLEGFARAAALEATRRIRVNVVSPPWVTETLQALGRPLEGGLPAAVVAKAYVRSVEGNETGRVISPGDGAGLGSAHPGFAARVRRERSGR
ncbi:MAG TPA: short chain dehydrogenase [Gemmatimonadales bacterium]|nr:short chain dehydrogenase [Gemmatimonadales bacterium]